MVPEPILVAEGVTKSYGSGDALLVFGKRKLASRPALINASLSLMAGETLGIVGESGSGKSTLARNLALLERPDAGKVIFKGEDLTKLPESALRRCRRRIQIIYQDPYVSLNPRMRVGDAIGEVLHVHHLVPRDRITARVRQLLDQVGLPSAAAGRYPTDFSGGQRQRICFARALAAEPDVLIADEPVSALDVSIQAQIVNLLMDLRDQLGVAVIFIGHDLELVDFVAPRIAVMLGGMIVEMLPPQTSLDMAKHPYTRALLAAVPSLQARPPVAGEPIAELAGGFPLSGCPFWDRCPYRHDPRCENETPPLVDVGGGHLLASFYVHSGMAGASALHT
jgi:oligopeptide/dipeptide ABC transporter ATP-binding protein